MNRVTDLHRALSDAGIAILGVACVDGQYSIRFAPQADESQRQQGQAILDGWPLEEARQAAVARVQAGFEAALVRGITLPGTSITLAAGAADRDAFVALATLMRDAVAEGLAAADAPVQITDLDGVEHTLSWSQARPLLVHYGMAWLALRARRQQKFAAARAAATVTQAQAVQFDD